MLVVKKRQTMEKSVLVIDDDEKLNQIFDEIDQKAEVGEFTQDEATQEDQEVDQETI